MNIQSAYPQKPIQKPAFKAVPLARYQVGQDDYVKIYQLEKRDVPFLTKFVKNIKQYFVAKGINDYSHRQVMEEAFNAGEKLLSSPDEQKAKVMLAVKDSNPCGILIANAMKEAKDGKIVYSSRKNHAKKETELDWLVSWNPFPEKSIKGFGKALTAEYFETLKADGFRDVYVRSEVPELSFASEFYKQMGFEPLSSGRESIVKSSTNRYLIGDLDTASDEVLPMVATPAKFQEAKTAVFDKFSRDKLNNCSVHIDTVINNSCL